MYITVPAPKYNFEEVKAYCELWHGIISKMPLWNCAVSESLHEWHYGRYSTFASAFVHEAAAACDAYSAYGGFMAGDPVVYFIDWDAYFKAQFPKEFETEGLVDLMRYYYRFYEVYSRPKFTKLLTDTYKSDHKTRVDNGYGSWFKGMEYEATNGYNLYPAAIQQNAKELAEAIVASQEQWSMTSGHKAKYVNHKKVKYVADYTDVVRFMLDQVVEDPICYQGLCFLDSRGRRMDGTDSYRVERWLGTTYIRAIALSEVKQSVSSEGLLVIEELKAKYSKDISLYGKLRTAVLNDCPTSVLACLDLKACAIQMYGLLLHDKTLLEATGVIPCFDSRGVPLTRKQWKKDREIWQVMANALGMIRDDGKKVVMRPVYGGDWVIEGKVNGVHKIRPIPDAKLRRVKALIPSIVEFLNLLNKPMTCDGKLTLTYFDNDTYTMYLNQFKYAERTDRTEYDWATIGNNVCSFGVLHSDFQFGVSEEAHRFLSTALIHHMDAWLVQAVLAELKDQHVWCKTCHDGYYCHPNDIPVVRDIVRKHLVYIYEHGLEIMRNFLTSVSQYMAVDVQQWVEDNKARYEEDLRPYESCDFWYDIT